MRHPAELDSDMNIRHAIAAAVLGCPLAAGLSLAHTTIELKEAPVGTTQKIVFRVPHGCDGSPTLKVRVQIPAGVVGVKPMPKAGWTLETVTGKLDTPYMDHGKEITEGLREVVWTGKLLEAHYDEFVIRGSLSADQLEPGATLYFPVVQECEQGAERWIEIPAAGKTSDALEMPAPGIKLLPKR
jgi:uncharacterized protein YcnI